MFFLIIQQLYLWFWIVIPTISLPFCPLLPEDQPEYYSKPPFSKYLGLTNFKTSKLKKIRKRIHFTKITNKPIKIHLAEQYNFLFFLIGFSIDIYSYQGFFQRNLCCRKVIAMAFVRRPTMIVIVTYDWETNVYVLIFCSFYLRKEYLQKHQQ